MQILDNFFEQNLNIIVNKVIDSTDCLWLRDIALTIRKADIDTEAGTEAWQLASDWSTLTLSWPLIGQH